MALHRRITAAGIYFITFTSYKWVPLIEQVKGYDLIHKWFDILVSGGHTIVGYVIMPNHIHLLLHYNGGPQSLNTIIGNGKRFLAYDIVKRLEQQGDNVLLKMLAEAVTSILVNNQEKRYWIIIKEGNASFEIMGPFDYTSFKEKLKSNNISLKFE